MGIPFFLTFILGLIMKTTLSVQDFREAFKRANRAKQFSHEALGFIYDYMEECDPDYELDVVEICCVISEQAPDDIAWDCGIDTSECSNDEETLQVVLQHLRDETIVIDVTEAGSIVYYQF